MCAGLDISTPLLTRTTIGGYFGSVVIGGALVGQSFWDEMEGEGYGKDTTKATRVPRG